MYLCAYCQVIEILYSRSSTGFNPNGQVDVVHHESMFYMHQRLFVRLFFHQISDKTIMRLASSIAVSVSALKRGCFTSKVSPPSIIDFPVSLLKCCIQKLFEFHFRRVVFRMYGTPMQYRKIAAVHNASAKACRCNA